MREDAPSTITTGFPSLDAALAGGLRPGELAVLGGEPGSGKSSLVLGIALRAAAAGIDTMLLSAEMRPDRLVERAAAILGRVRVDELRGEMGTPDARAATLATRERLAAHGPVLDLLPAGGVVALDHRLRRDDAASALLIVDPLQALTGGALPLAEDVAAQVRELKALAVRRDVALLCTSHLAAAAADRPDARPRLGDFGALGAIAQHADLVFGLFREEMHGPAHGIEGATELLVLKNRRGTLGYVDLYFYGQWLRFEDVMEPDEPPAE